MKKLLAYALSVGSVLAKHSKTRLGHRGRSMQQRLLKTIFLASLPFRNALFVLVLFSSTGSVNAASCEGGPADSFRLTGIVKHKATHTLDSLRNFRLDPTKEYTPTTITVTFNTSQGRSEKTYTGIPLIDLLTVAQVKTNSKQKNDILRKYVAVRATDCYEAVVALGEILPNFEGKMVLVAYEDGTGQPLSTDGMARLVVPGDAAGGRFVSNITKIKVLSAPK